MNAWVIDPPARPSLPVRGAEAEFPLHRVYCVGRNYAEHVREMGSPERGTPIFFSKPADAVTTASEIPYPPGTSDLHHEVELVVALKEGGCDLSTDAARAAIYGYAVGVDLTRRDLQAEAKKKRAPWDTAKGFDHSAPVSPILRAQDVEHPEAAAIRLAVNGLMRQQGNTSEMIWTVPEIISELSRLFELKAGDLVFTGTPAGVAALKRGDLVGCAIEGVGTLAFTVV